MPDAPAHHLAPPWWRPLWDAMGPGPEPAPLTRWQTAWRLGLAGLLSVGTFALIWFEPGRSFRLDAGRAVLLGGELVAFPFSLWLVQQRRRRPVLVAMALTAISAVFTSVIGASLLALFSLAARRHLRGMLLVLPATVGASVFVNRVVWPGETQPHIVGELITTTLSSALLLAIGYGVGARRAVKQSAHDRLEAAAREQEARVAQAAAHERTRIAREMHDVLAHRISLVAMHAGALNYREDLSDEERRTAAATIERNAREALTELREVLGVLRDPGQVADLGSAPERPQPTLRDLAALVAEARTLGASLEVSDESGEVPERVGRTAYRIVQEALTNARKHAPDRPVRVRLSQHEDLVVEVRNPLPDAAHVPPPGAGVGLLGLRERVTLVGGTLDAGPEAGDWIVRARIPLGP